MEKMIFYGWCFKSEATVLVALTFFGFAQSAVPYNQLFPAVEAVDGIRLLNFSNSYSKLVDLDFFVHYAMNNYSQVYINFNGILTFGKGVDWFWNYNCSSGTSPGIAPFWAYVNRAGAGKILYQTTKNPILLEKASIDIFRAFSREDQNITNLFIVTWQNVSTDKEHGSGQNTFQVAIATDGVRTFVLMYFHQLQWPKQMNGYKAFSGFFNEFKTPSYSLVGSCRDDLIKKVTHNSNINAPGKWVFQVDSFSVQLPNLRSEFRNFQESNDWTHTGNFVSLLGKGTLIIQDRFTGILRLPSDTVVNCSFGELAGVQGSLLKSMIICEVPLMSVLGITDVQVSVVAKRESKNYHLLLSVVKNEDLKETAEFRFSQLHSAGDKLVLVEATWPAGSLKLDDTFARTKEEIAFVLLERVPDSTWSETKLCTEEINQSIVSMTKYSCTFKPLELLQIIQHHLHPIFAVQYAVTLLNGKRVSKQVISDVLEAEKILEILQTSQEYAEISSLKCKHAYEEAISYSTRQIHNSSIIDCPLTAAQAEADMRFARKDGNGTPSQSSKSVNFFSQIFATHSSNGAVCSYDKIGKQIVGAPSGSRLDFFGPYNAKDLWLHYQLDVLPYWYCCKDSGKNTDVCTNYFYGKRGQLHSSGTVSPKFASVFGFGHVIPFGQAKSFSVNGIKGLVWLIKYYNKGRNSVFQIQGKFAKFQQTDASILKAISIRDVYKGNASVVECSSISHSADMNVQLKFGVDREFQFKTTPSSSNKKSFVYNENLQILAGPTNSLDLVFQSGFAVSVISHQNNNTTWISVVVQHSTPFTSSLVLEKGCLFQTNISLPMNYSVSAGNSIFLTNQDTAQNGSSLVVPTTQDMQLDFQECDKQSECLFDFRITRDFAFARITKEGRDNHQAILDAFLPTAFLLPTTRTTYKLSESTPGTSYAWYIGIALCALCVTIMIALIIKCVASRTQCSSSNTQNRHNYDAKICDENEYAEITGPICQNASVVYSRQRQLSESPKLM